MVHEPYLPFRQKHFRHTVLAVAHRFMLAAALRGARRAWIAIPEWEKYCRPYALGRRIPFAWLPVASNIAANGYHPNLDAVRARYASSCKWLIGHFGTCGGEIGVTLRAVIPKLLRSHQDTAVLLIGRDSNPICDELSRDHPALQGRIRATGMVSSSDASSHITACDVMLQPYPDGATTRRGSLMAALAHGKAVVTTSGRLTEPLWNDGFVELAPAGDYAEIVRSIENLLADDDKRERLARAAKIMYDRRFGLPHIIKLLRNG
jgi:glycosyltransferase involved in cell wall biosynthesis